MKVTEIKVAALVYTLSNSKIVFMGIDGMGNRQFFASAEARDLIPKLDSLHEELNDGVAVARGKLPALRDFVENWGRQLLPPKSWIENADVLVIVPQGILHNIPLHLVLINQQPLGTLIGITYSSSMSLLSRCMNRNPERKRDLDNWQFEEESPQTSESKPRKAVVGGVDVLGSKDSVFKGIASQIAEYLEGEVTDFSKGNTEFNRLNRYGVKAGARANILCVVAHGYIDPNNQRMSGLLLARDPMGVRVRNIPLHGGRYFDFRDLPLLHFPSGLRKNVDAEILTSAELEIDTTFDSELVLLLGCSTATDRIFPGDEPASLAETFLHVGACSVLASSWDIDADFIKEWSKYFFNGWLTGHLPKALAFRQTMRELAKGPWKDRPERLGCMVLKGDWL